MPAARDKRLLAMSAVLSLAAHGVLMVGLHRVEIRGPEELAAEEAAFELEVLDESQLPPELFEPPPPPEPEPKPPLMLGVEQSTFDTETWLGFEDPTPHLARQAEVEQAALDPNPRSSAAPVEPVPPPPTERIAEHEAEAPLPPQQPETVVTPRPSEPPPDIEVLDRAVESVRSALAAGIRLLAPVEGETVMDGDPAERQQFAEKPPPPPPPPQQPLPSPADSPAPEPEPRTVPVSASRPQDRPPQPNPAPSSESDRGSEKSEKESPATALVDSVEVRPGRPAAAQGLDITTRRPVFTTYTRALRQPRNPEVLVTFDRKGRVSEAKIVRSAGSWDVDEPVLNAVYGWTAKGKAIDELDPRDPTAGVTIRMRILLR